MRLAQADRLTRTTGLDLVEAGWRPTFGNYLNRVTKPRILEAVREGAGERAAQLIDHMKKGDMAKEAERLLADSGWLPDPLRLAGVDGVPASDANRGGATVGPRRPDFLRPHKDSATSAAGRDTERQHGEGAGRDRRGQDCLLP